MVSGVKNAVVDWRVFDPQLLKNDKSRRGFHHDECGYLLCPIDYDWNNNRYVILSYHVLYDMVYTSD